MLAQCASFEGYGAIGCVPRRVITVAKKHFGRNTKSGLLSAFGRAACDANTQIAGAERVCDYQTNTSALPTQNGITTPAAPQIGHC